MPRWIVQRPGVLGGKPYVTGTRLTVEGLRQEIAAGASPEDLLKAHPELSKEALDAARAYTVQVLHKGIVRPGHSRDEFDRGSDREPGAIGEDSYLGHGR